MSTNNTAQLTAGSLPLIGRARLPDVRKADTDEKWKQVVGSVVERVRVLAALSLKEFAREVGKEERQIARWMDGTDRPQFDAIWSVPVLRVYLVIAWAELARDEVELTTTISIRRTA